MDFRKYSKKNIILILIVSLVFFGVGYFWGSGKSQSVGNKNENRAEDKNFSEVRQTGFHFINPLLECEVGNFESENVSFESRIKNEIKNEMSSEFPEVFYSVYFRNLNNGPWFGINENEDFSPASLLKVPIMMAFLKESEKNPEILNEKILYRGTPQSFNQKIDPAVHIEPGKEYVVGDLIDRMITHSDNEALLMLYQKMDKKNFESVFSDLGIAMPNMNDANNMMSVKDYASFFRILYNASYLNRELSEKALEILSRIDYKDGLRAEVPENISVAHKFGEREAQSGGGIVRQLHDCGIVYYEKYPYLICIMTRGKNQNELSSSIRSISKIVFEEVKKN